MPKVFISYSHDSEAHRDRVLSLSERLRADGVETLLDQYVKGSPVEGWPRWMLDQLDAADFVLVICTEVYYRRFRGREQPGRGKGVTWEGALITQEIYDSYSRTGKFVPVFLAAPVETCIPEPLRAHTFYALTSKNAYDSLYDYLLAQSGVEPTEVGTPRIKPRRRVAPLTFDDPAGDDTQPEEEAAEPAIPSPPPRQPKRPKPQQPPPLPASLLEVLVGRWQVQIQLPFTPGVMGQLQIDLFPTGMFRGQLMTPLGLTGVEGQWQADPVHNQLGLQGVQSNGYQAIPYAVMVQITSFNAHQVLGVTSVGEQIHWHRVNPPGNPPPLTPF